MIKMVLITFVRKQKSLGWMKRSHMARWKPKVSVAWSLCLCFSSSCLDLYFLKLETTQWRVPWVFVCVCHHPVKQKVANCSAKISKIGLRHSSADNLLQTEMAWFFMSSWSIVNRQDYNKIDWSGRASLARNADCQESPLYLDSAALIFVITRSVLAKSTLRNLPSGQNWPRA